MKKYIFGAVLSIGLLVSPAFTQAAGLTTVQINAILSLLSSFGADQSVINNVQASLTGSASTTGGQSFCHNFNSDLTGGSSGDDVVALNQALSSSGIDTTGNSSSFNENNAGDVVSFQAKYGIRQTGYVGPMTRAKLNVLYGCHSDQQSTSSLTKEILPTKVGQCSKTTIKTIGTRLTNSQTGQNIPNSGSFVSYTNGGTQVSYSTEPSAQDWSVGDQTDFCLVGLPTNCPVGDERGKTYKVTNLRTGETWEAPNSEHNCGGA